MNLNLCLIIVLLALGDGHLQPHVVALLLAVLSLCLLPAHGQGQL